MTTYSVALALEDFVPVLLSAVGLTLIVRLVALRSPASAGWAALGAVLVVAGGLSRATWKLIVALDGGDVGPLYVALFPLLVGGYLLLGRTTWGIHDRASPGASWAWVPAVIGLAGLGLLTVVGGSPEGRLLPLAWLAVATLGSAAFTVALFRWARFVGRPRLALLFLLSLGITIVLNGIARTAQESEAIQWIQQGVNTGNQLLFLLAAHRLDRAVRSASGPGHTPEAVPATVSQ